MKKYISILLALAIIFTFTACKTTVTETETNSEIEGYLEEGYEWTAMSATPDSWVALLYLDGNYIKVSCPITEAQYETIANTEMDEEELEAYYLTFIDATCEVLTPPSQEDLDSLYVGKTVEDLVALDFSGPDMWDENYDEESYFVYMYGPEYVLTVTFEGEINANNISSFSDDDKNEFVVATVEFLDYVI